LESSKQRKDKPEQGHYVNACRRTVGRTCSLGVHGIRQKLREQYGRSPDPDEVAAEMQRHKGYGKKKNNTPPTIGERGQGISESIVISDSLHMEAKRSKVDYNYEEGEPERQNFVFKLPLRYVFQYYAIQFLL